MIYNNVKVLKLDRTDDIYILEIFHNNARVLKNLYLIFYIPILIK